MSKKPLQYVPNAHPEFILKMIPHPIKQGYVTGILFLHAVPISEHAEPVTYETLMTNCNSFIETYLAEHATPEQEPNNG